METRQEIEKVKKRKQDLEILFSSAEKLCDATAEVAFASGKTLFSYFWPSFVFLAILRENLG